MISYATPLDRAKALKDELVSYAEARDYPLPTTRYAQVGEIIRDCESVIVSAGNMAPDINYDPIECLAVRSATFLVDIIRSCAVVYDSRSGLSIPSVVEDVSERASLDGELLFSFADDLEGWSGKQPWSVLWSSTDAGMFVTELQITIGIP